LTALVWTLCVSKKITLIVGITIFRYSNANLLSIVSAHSRAFNFIRILNYIYCNKNNWEADQKRTIAKIDKIELDSNGKKRNIDWLSQNKSKLLVYESTAYNNLTQIKQLKIIIFGYLPT